MEKLKRYVGFLFALALLIVGLLPVGPNPYYNKAARLSPFDNSALSRVTTGEGLMLFWLRGSDSLVACPPFVQRSKTCNSILDIVNWLPSEHQDEFRRIDPDAMAIVEKYAASFNQGTPKEVDEVRTVANELRVGTGVAKYLESKRKSLALQRYLLHFGWFLLCALLFVGRRQVGGLLLFPLNLVTGAAGAGAKAAKSIHDRI